MHCFPGGGTFEGPDAAETNAVLREDHPGPLHDLGRWDSGRLDMEDLADEYGGFLSHRGTPSYHPFQWDFP